MRGHGGRARTWLFAAVALITLAATAPVAQPGEFEQILGRRYARASTAKFAPVVRTDTFGVNIDGLWNQFWTWTPAARQAHFKAMADAGINTVRAGVVWEELEKCRPSLVQCPMGIDWRRHDEWIGAVVQAGLKPDMVLGWSALWASSVPGTEFAPPSDANDFARFSADVAKRYGVGGRFWKDNPELPYRPVTTYEIWNEQNMQWWWRPYPDPGGYASLYLTTRAALKTVDPAAVVVVGGVASAPWTDWDQVKDTEFVRQMFISRPELAGKMDGLGYHPYGQSGQEVLNQVKAMRTTLRGVGAGKVPMYITEMGWASDGWVNRKMDEATRAQTLASTIDQLVRSNCGVRFVAPYTWVSGELDPSAELDWMGIYNRDATPKPTGAAYADLARRLQGFGPTRPPGGTFKMC